MNMRADVGDVVGLDACELRMVDGPRVRRVQETLPAPELIEELANGVFGLLADRNRLRLLMSLLEGGELCVCDLAASTGMSESATSHALRLLRAHRVVKVRRDGRMAYYSLKDGHVRLLLDVALEHLRHGDE
ncbi:MAG: transcriptional regulator, ArsR family [Acidimicrobiales bacterium]|nr:transcriptional regulator, ArsR family [Acidimicrobiales bacterium]